ncbi:hypothetical protein KKC87_04400 [Patescibacteria group bacterium]|nr:hypothetical protein [Patescibacteria group bacterium]
MYKDYHEEGAKKPYDITQVFMAITSFVLGSSLVYFGLTPSLFDMTFTMFNSKMSIAYGGFLILMSFYIMVRRDLYGKTELEV